MLVCKQETSLEALPEEILLGEFISPAAAKQLITKYGGIYHILLHTSEQQIGSVSGIGKVGLKRIASLKAVIQRLEEERKKQILSITKPQDVADYYTDMQDLQQEEIRVLLLNTKNKILGQKKVFLGMVNFSLASAREIFHAAVQAMASTIIVVHNHPSGDPAPSREDEEVTKTLVHGGKILNIPILDHIIVGKDGYYSFKEKGNIEIT
ncbi:UPF0758 protein [Sporomusaceae bacterium FL31]|nr:UPF0758 protein [Sporomusaceae bacterium FL31]GCE32805.1 UPF0758 protein [Sporomusaceae bacterium]